MSAIVGGTGRVVSTDVIPIVDVLDATQAPQGSVVKITLAQLYRTEFTPVTVSTPLPDIAQTWNAGAVAFTAVKLNVTDTASAAASLLLDLQVATVSKFSVRKDGVLTATGGTFSGTVAITNGTVVGGASYFRVLNNATTFANLQVNDAGDVTIRNGLTVSANGITVTGASSITGALSGITTLAAGSVTTASVIATLAGALTIRTNDTNSINFLVNSTQYLTINSFGQVGFSTSVFTNATASEVVLANTKGLRGVTTLGTDTKQLIALSGGNQVSIDAGGMGALFGGGILFSTAISQIVPGATSISLRNTANTADNLLITDAGAATFRNTVGGITTLSCTTVTATNLGGTLSTAAQPNVTSVGTLNGATIVGITISNIVAPTVAAGNVGLGTTTAATVGAAGGGSAPPATPVGYWIFNVGGTAYKIPYYNS